MSAEYLTTPIVAARITSQPNYGMGRDGYTLRSGAPTWYLIQLQGEKRWRRLMVWQFSNAGTCFVRVKGKALIVSHTWDIQKLAGAKS